MFDEPVPLIHSRGWKPPDCSLSLDQFRDILPPLKMSGRYAYTINALLLHGRQGREVVAQAYRGGLLARITRSDRYQCLIWEAKEAALSAITYHRFENASLDLMLCVRLEERGHEQTPTFADLERQKKQLYTYALQSRDCMERALINLVVTTPIARMVIESIKSPEELGILGAALFGLYWGDVLAPERLRTQKEKDRLLATLKPDEPSYASIKRHMLNLGVELQTNPATNLFVRLPPLLEEAIESLDNAKRGQSGVLEAARCKAVPVGEGRDHKIYLSSHKWGW